MPPRKTGLLEQLFAEKSAAVQAFFRRRLRAGSGLETADLTQEAYSRLLNASRLRTIQDPEAYLFTVARHLLEGFRAGIERLIDDGIADPEKVGLIAFSRTGYHTLHLLARHPQLLAAASMSDSIQVGYLNYLLGVGQLVTESGYAKLTGGAPDVANIGEWFARNPLYAIGRSRAAIRLEEMWGGLGFWETYALLRWAGKPVDFVVYPDGSHVLQKPVERLASQGGNVDWFRFWLQGYEDPAESKKEQYRRWRAFKERQ